MAAGAVTSRPRTRSPRRGRPFGGGPAGQAAGGRDSTTGRRCCDWSDATRSSRSPGPAGSARRGSPSMSRPTRPRRRPAPTSSSSTSPRSTGPTASARRSPPRSVCASAARSVPTTSPTRWRGHDLLLVLDNCEHVAAACRDLVGHAAASRRRRAGARHVAGDPPRSGGVRRAAAAAAGPPGRRRPRRAAAPARCPRVPRARPTPARRLRARPTADAADLVEVLRRLDGLPLGIELAARQVSVMPVRAVRERLDRALDLVTGRPTARTTGSARSARRSRSSYRSARRRRAAACCAPSRRSPAASTSPEWSDLAAVVAPDHDPLDLLHPLVDSSLLVADAAAGRYRLLFTVRAVPARRAGRPRGARRGRGPVPRPVPGDRARDRRPDDRSRRTGAADRRLRAELDNLRAARDVAAARGRARRARRAHPRASRRPRPGATCASCGPGPTSSAADPGWPHHPDRPRMLGAAAEAARLLGDLDLADRLAAGGPRRSPGRTPTRGRSAARYSAAALRGALPGRLRRAPATGGCGRSEGRRVGHRRLARLGRAGRGVRRRAHERATLLDRAHARRRPRRATRTRAFASYVDGELRATTRVEAIGPCYLSRRSPGPAAPARPSSTASPGGAGLRPHAHR